MEDAASTDTIREELVETAVKFLHNPKVSQATDARKKEFLVKKGLSVSEIDLAFKKYGATNGSALIPGFDQQNGQLVQQQPSHSNWRDYGNGIVLIGGVSYMIYRVFRKFILPKFFAVDDPEEQRLVRLEEQISQINTSMQFISDSINQTLSILQRQQDSLLALSDTNQNSGALPASTSANLAELQKEVATIKGILLSRNQFPALPTGLTVPVLPSWQRPAPLDQNKVEVVSNGSDHDDLNGDDEPTQFYSDQESESIKLTEVDEDVISEVVVNGDE